MAKFFYNHIAELIEYSSTLVQQQPNDPATISVHLALLDLANYLNINSAVPNKSLPDQQKRSDDVNFLDLIAKKAQMANPFALFLLGILKLEGLPPILACDQISGCSLIALSAANSCHWAMHAMGNFYMRGNNFFQQNFQTAEQYFAKALAKTPEDKRALRNLGLCCLYQGNKQHQAIHYLLLASKYGDTTMQQIYNISAKATANNKAVINHQPTTAHVADPAQNKLAAQQQRHKVKLAS